MKYEIPAMLARGGGTIVNPSSDLTVLGLPGTALYTASKSGVDALTRCAATDFGRQGIRVAVVWLCSARSGHVNGQILNIDGGLTLL
jgi:NAD(P)-dependent dehydrogenase (short-subunit alcohol dehydrogenase family)